MGWDGSGREMNNRFDGTWKLKLIRLDWDGTGLSLVKLKCFRKCDSPLRTIESMYRHISKKHPNIELIYWTGDLPPHDIWNQTRQGNLEVLRETSKQLRQHFPDKVILPALGNHESVPVDSFPPPFVHGEHSISWLYTELNQEWTQWIGAGHGPTLRYGGYYSVNSSPGLRVISLNMNYCMNKNIWLLMNSTDPAQELKWLVYELQLAEFKGEKVVFFYF